MKCKNVSLEIRNSDIDNVYNETSEGKARRTKRVEQKSCTLKQVESTADDQVPAS